MIIPGAASVNELESAIGFLRAVSDVADPKKLAAALEAIKSEREALQATTDKSIEAARALAIAEKSAQEAKDKSRAAVIELEGKKAEVAAELEAAASAHSNAKELIKEVERKSAALAIEKADFDAHVELRNKSIEAERAAIYQKVDESMAELAAQKLALSAEQEKAKALAAEYESKLERIRELSRG